jgi:hypothetical protein
MIWNDIKNINEEILDIEKFFLEMFQIFFQKIIIIELVNLKI